MITGIRMTFFRVLLSVHPYLCPSVRPQKIFPTLILSGVWVDRDQICAPVWLRPDPRSRSRSRGNDSQPPSRAFYFNTLFSHVILAFCICTALVCFLGTIIIERFSLGSVVMPKGWGNSMISLSSFLFSMLALTIGRQEGLRSVKNMLLQRGVQGCREICDHSTVHTRNFF